jgi:translation elongation factor EF-G
MYHLAVMSLHWVNVPAHLSHIEMQVPNPRQSSAQAASGAARVISSQKLHCCLQGVRVVLETGASHAVDSSDVAFRLAAIGAFRQAFSKAAPVVLEPQMAVEVRAPVEYQGALMGDLNRRRGIIQDAVGELEDTVITAQVRNGRELQPLSLCVP